MGEGGGGLWFGTGGVSGRSEGAGVWTHSATSGMSGPTKRGVAQGGTTGWESGTGGVEVALARGQTKAGFHPGDTA